MAMRTWHQLIPIDVAWLKMSLCWFDDEEEEAPKRVNWVKSCEYCWTALYSSIVFHPVLRAGRSLASAAKALCKNSKPGDSGVVASEGDLVWRAPQPSHKTAEAMSQATYLGFNSSVMGESASWSAVEESRV
jgi:hypothetical protein